MINALHESKGNKSKAAKKLGIARSTLYEKMYQHQLL
ncbi:helix-turn-helix domain-containing protein [Neobacillus drentensis]